MSRSFSSTHTEWFQDFISFSVQSEGIFFESIVSLSILQSSEAFQWSSVYYGLHVFQGMNVGELILSTSKMFVSGDIITRYFTILVENLGKTVKKCKCM